MSGNPKRGCGTKKEDSFYLESDLVPGGGLHSWTWVCGDGIYEVIPLTIPPRKTIFVNPAAVLSEKELVTPEDGFTLNGRYRAMLEKTKDLGIGDHVGKNNYSAWSFAEEAQLYGPSRRITKQDARVYAEVLNQHGPIPMLFTHSRVPCFTDRMQRDRAIYLTERVIEEDPQILMIDATWDDPDWGQYKTFDQTNGDNHFMTRVFSLLDSLDKNWAQYKERAGYIEAKKFFSKVSFFEQPIGLSWLTQVTYTLPEDGEIEDGSIFDIPNINVLDLREDLGIEKVSIL